MSVSAILRIMDAVRDSAAKAGYEGDRADYEQTAADMDYITEQLLTDPAWLAECGERKPTRAEWAEAGLRWVGDRHCSGAE